MIRLHRKAGYAALIAGILLGMIAAPLAAQSVQSEPAPVAANQAATPTTEPAGPRVRAELPRVEPQLSRNDSAAPMTMHKKTTTITVTTLVLVLAVVILVLLIVR